MCLSAIYATGLTMVNQRSGFPQRSRFVSLLITSFLWMHCSQRRGDLDHVEPNPFVPSSPIADINDPAHRAAKDSTVTARSVVVTAADNFDETNDGKSIGNIYVQDTVQAGPKGTPWSGIMLFEFALSPPDLFLIPGDGVTITGTYQPFDGPSNRKFEDGLLLPEIVRGTLTLSYEDRPPQPVDITLDDLINPQQGMSFTGRLVRLNNVTIQEAFNFRLEAKIANIENSPVLAGQLFPINSTPGLDVSPNTKFKSVTGILNYFYSFKLCPRSPLDFEK